MSRSDGTRRVVGLGLMVYRGSTALPIHVLRPTRAYLESLADFAAWLLEHDYDIRLLLGDDDAIVIEEFRSVLEARLGGYDEVRVIEQPIASVRGRACRARRDRRRRRYPFPQCSPVLCLLNKPVIAISFHHKCSSLMRQMKLAEYCHEIDQVDADRLIAQFRKLEQNREAVKLQRSVRAWSEARAALDEQYDLLFVSRERRSRLGDMSRRQGLRERFESAFLGVNERIWGRLPASRAWT